MLPLGLTFFFHVFSPKVAESLAVTVAPPPTNTTTIPPIGTDAPPLNDAIVSPIDTDAPPPPTVAPPAPSDPIIVPSAATVASDVAGSAFV